MLANHQYQRYRVTSCDGSAGVLACFRQRHAEATNEASPEQSLSLSRFGEPPSTECTPHLVGSVAARPPVSSCHNPTPTASIDVESPQRGADSVVLSASGQPSPSVLAPALPLGPTKPEAGQGASRGPRTIATLQVQIAICERIEQYLAVELTPPAPTSVTPFHSSAAPPIPLARFACRIAHYSGYGAEGIAFGLALMARYARATHRVPTVLTAHRLLLACIVVGMKTNCDLFVQNKYMAPITGVPLNELNWLESTLLDALEFSAIPRDHEVFDLPRLLVELPDRRRPPCYAPATPPRSGRGAGDLMASLLRLTA